MSIIQYKIVQLPPYIDDVETYLNTIGMDGYQLVHIYNGFAYLQTGGGGGGGAAFPYTGAAVITGSLTVTGPLNYVSSSLIYDSGSSHFGNSPNDLMQVTGSVNVLGSSTASAFWAYANSNGTNFRVGDDAWIGDIDAANTMQVKGIQNSDRGYVRFGNNNLVQQIGSDGTNLIISVQTGSINVVGNVTASGHIIPNTDEQYDLGSPTKKWRAVYVSGSSIYLGNIKLTDNQGQLTVYTTASNSTTVLPMSGAFTGSFKGNGSQITNITFPAGTVSSSGQVSYAGLTNIPSDIVSSSLQINTGSFSGSFVGTLSGTITSASYASTASYALSAAAVAGNPVVSVAKISTNHTASLSDCALLLSASSITVLLPNAVGNTGKVYYVKNLLSVGTQTVKSVGGRVEGVAGSTGIATTTIGNSDANYIFVSDGTDWWELGTH